MERFDRAVFAFIHTRDFVSGCTDGKIWVDVLLARVKAAHDELSPEEKMLRKMPGREKDDKNFVWLLLNATK